MLQPFDLTAFNTTADCYPGDEYSHMKACQECSGPGPTQCTLCQAEHALVLWRRNATEGACRDITDQMQSQTITNGNETTLSKWGNQRLPLTTLPAVAALRAAEVNEVVIAPICSLQKSMRCIKTSAGTKCDVWKRAWLSSIPQLKCDMKKALIDFIGYEEADWPADHLPWAFDNFPVTRLLEIADIASINEACASAVQLL